MPGYGSARSTSLRRSDPSLGARCGRHRGQGRRGLDALLGLAGRRAASCEPRRRLVVVRSAVSDRLKVGVPTGFDLRTGRQGGITAAAWTLIGLPDEAVICTILVLVIAYPTHSALPSCWSSPSRPNAPPSSKTVTRWTTCAPLTRCWPRLGNIGDRRV